MILPIVVVIVAIVRLLELLHANQNTRRLLARGGVELAPEQHQWFIGLHAAWLVSLIAFVPWSKVPNWWLIAVFVVLQVLRVWVVMTLGPFWTTRIITLPGAPLVRRGPYRVLRHPNYVIVCAELLVLPLAFGAWQLAVIFSIFNALLLRWRIRVENTALAARSHLLA